MSITQTDVKLAVVTGFILGIATLIITQCTKMAKGG